MSGRDVVGQSQTGSGKTAAFAIRRLKKPNPDLKAVQVLILCPTRELAVQVSEEFLQALRSSNAASRRCRFTAAKSTSASSGDSARRTNRHRPRPGRVMDHMRRGTIRLAQIKMVILDEADVMLNMGSAIDIENHFERCAEGTADCFFPPQCRVRSATLIENIRTSRRT